MVSRPRDSGITSSNSSSSPLVSRQDVSLDGGADGHHLVRIDVGERLTPEQAAHRLANAGHAGRTADHHHRLHILDFDAGIPHCAAAGLEAARHHGLDQRLEVGTGQTGGPATVGNIYLVGRGKRFLGGAGHLQQVALGTGIQVSGKTGLLDDPASDGMVEVITAEGAVTAGGQDLEDATGQAKDGNVEGAAAQVIDGDNTLGLLVQAIGDRCRRRLIEQAQHIQAS